MKVFTIGFTQKDAETFFSILSENHVKRLFDIRLNNVSQLAGFTKMQDLRFFLKRILNVEYSHRVECAPTDNILNDYKKKKTSWNQYETEYLALLEIRHIERNFTNQDLDGSVFLCSESSAKQCHRRLCVEYLAKKFPGIEIEHL